MKKLLCLCLAVILALSVAGCGTSKNAGRTEDGRIYITYDGMANKDTNPEGYAKQLAIREEFMEKYPEICIEGDTWSFSVDTFAQKAAAEQLPTLFYMPFTEVRKCNTTDYMKELTPLLEKYGYMENYTDQILDLCKTEDGKMFCVPYSAYVLGLLCNIEMYEAAGLKNPDGTIQIPQTFDELAESASKIKKATGNAGYTIPTKNNCGGWHFMNIARAFGVVFMEEDANGKWTAKFDDENGIAALQYIKDLRWKYDALSNNALIDNPEMYKMFATNQTASIFAAAIEISTGKTFCVTNGMDMNNLSLGLTPAGPKGRYALMGGGIRCVPSNATDEQADAVFKYLDFTGVTHNITEEAVKNIDTSYAQYAEEGIPILAKEPYSVWKSGNAIEKTNEIRAKYSQLDMNKMKEYYDGMPDVTIVPEEPIACQELYSLLDGCIQEVITNKNADVAQLLKDAAQNFQVNYLDNI